MKTVKNREKPNPSSPAEVFSTQDTIFAIVQWLEFGETYAQKTRYQKGGYFSNFGWAARCLRSHLRDLRMSPKFTLQTLDQLKEAVDARRSVLVDPWHRPGKPIPAAFLYAMPANLVHRAMQQGVILYEKQKKP